MMSADKKRKGFRTDLQFVSSVYPHSSVSSNRYLSKNGLC
jgi:hypothetical protein